MELHQFKNIEQDRTYLEHWVASRIDNVEYHNGWENKCVGYKWNSAEYASWRAGYDQSIAEVTCEIENRTARRVVTRIIRFVGFFWRHVFDRFFRNEEYIRD